MDGYHKYLLRFGVVALVLASVLGCGLAGGKDVEGDEAGECRDGADNDQDGDFDCDDEDCVGSPDCEEVTDGVTPTSTTSTTSTNTGSCVWAGTWDVTQSWCGSIDITQDWEAKFDATEMLIDHSETDDCDVRFTLSSASCVERESWTILGTSGGASMEIRFDGIDSCDPDGCTLTPDDVDACLVGDHAEPGVGVFDLDNSMGDGIIRITGLLPNAIPECPLSNAVTTQWERR